MMKHEFEARIEKEITPEQWEMVELVYMNTDYSKDDVANIWKAGGPARIEAMANKIRCDLAEEKAAELEGRVERLSDDIGEYENALVDSRRELEEAEAENTKLREMVAKLEAELREACVALFRAQREVA